MESINSEIIVDGSHCEIVGGFSREKRGKSVLREGEREIDGAQRPMPA